MSGWRYWFAFEVKPGIMRGSRRDMSAHWRGLAAACRRPDGSLDAEEYTRWLDCVVERSHQWGSA